mmetsp:Transcript_30964/g.64728  ORF Transcript_30964/g.64728 Transcript_30964/m.64728 type:complete len:336 (+) Transcript_30964:410-1417(+)
MSAFAAGSVDSFHRNFNNHHYYYNPHSVAGGSSHAVSGVKNDNEEFYYDDTNDHSWVCSFGTEEGDGIWLNRNDPPGALMAVIVWVLLAYSGITVALLAESDHLSHILAMIYLTICALALASHAKTMFSDPGAIPQCAVPVDSAARRLEAHTMCSTCRSFKPPGTHHCRICNRCISRMDHHCPWMNNCVGAANLKSFVLFLCYTWIGSALALVIFGCNYFFCREESCEFSGVLVYLVRVMTLLCIGSLLFTSTILSNMMVGIMTGLGTIDRMKQRLQSTTNNSADPLELEDIFGIGNYLTWLFPIDPIFSDYDDVLRYSMPQRLLREGSDSISEC